MKNNNIKLDMANYNNDIPKKMGRPTQAKLMERDKIAKLYALAEKLHVKIGGCDDRP